MHTIWEHPIGRLALAHPMGPAQAQLDLNSRPMKICEFFILKFCWTFSGLKKKSFRCGGCHFYCVVIGRWPGGRFVLLFACVVALPHINAGEFPFKKIFPVPLIFSLLFSCFFLLCHVQNSFHFSLTFLLLCVFALAVLPVGLCFVCFSVVFLYYLLAWALIQFSINFIVNLNCSSPYSTQFCRVEIHMYVGLSLGFLLCSCWCVTWFSPLSPLLSLFIWPLRLFHMPHVRNCDCCVHRHPVMCLIV